MTTSYHIQTKVIDGQQPGPHLLIIGGVHGDEFEPMVAIRRLAAQIDPAQLRGRLTLAPVVNEPAFIKGHRTAEDDLDLARTCPGDPEGTITERIAHAVSELIRTADYFIDLHTGGTRMSVWPMTGYKLHADLEIRATSRRMARAFNLPVTWGTDPNLQGRTLSIARDAGIPTIYAEYLGAATCDSQGIEAYVEGCLNVMGEVGMIERTVTASKVQYEIEDHRPSAGHMQICNPSPMTGYFEPAVALGDVVQVGDCLGTVCDPLGEKSITITTKQQGVVLVLWTYPRVMEGDPLAVIMETDPELLGG